ncbi:hypothetical protein [Paenibacillus sp. NPDC058174]|uniref:hypothetical protein n=1 Tax=Paenibacillus sp. NPDC058174 TaxID=3346366 RepID=UPI0036DA950C
MSYNSLLNSPVDTQDFIWLAEYKDATFFPEISYDGVNENNFQDIDRTKLLRFGLIGMGMNMHFDVMSGIFNIAGRRIEILYQDNATGKQYNLTGQPMVTYNDIIQFKNAEAIFNPSDNRGNLDSQITQYNFGYKQQLNIHDINFYFKAICGVPYGRNIYLNLHLVADRAFNNGIIMIKKNGAEIFELAAAMNANETYELNWEVT